MPAADDDVIEHADIEQPQGRLEPLRDTPVRAAWLGDAGRVVVSEDDRRGAVLQGAHGYLPGVHRGAIEGAEEQIFAAQKPVLAVEEQTGEYLAAAGGEVVLQKEPRPPRTAHDVPVTQLLLYAAPSQLQRRLQLRILAGSDTGFLSETGAIHGQHPGEITRPPEQRAGDVEGAGPGATGAQHHGQQLRVGKHPGTVLQQLFPRPFARRPVPDRHRRPSLPAPPPVSKGRPRCYLRLLCGPCPGPIRPMTHLFNRNVLLGVCGGIAAYKAAQLVRELQARGATVRVIMTRGAEAFITPLTLQALSTFPVHRRLLDEEAERGMGHIELARWADLLLVAPATADCLARLAGGRADDLLTTVALATDAPLLLAPAMNQAMWADPATAANLETLTGRGVHTVGPDAGDQACGDVGLGRMSEPATIAERAAGLFESGALAGLRVMITAGPTREALDPVRFLSNHSSGKMGFALAAACADAGARTELISGPVTLATPPRVSRTDVVSARDMYEAALAGAGSCDLFIACAAVADYRPRTVAGQKIKKQAETLELLLERNPDIVASVAALRPGPFTVGFAAETCDLLAHARGKLESKGLDLVVANDVSHAGTGFDADRNAVTLLWPDGEETLPEDDKAALARAIVNRIAAQLRAARGGDGIPPTPGA